jgi:hypothetical protein
MSIKSKRLREKEDAEKPKEEHDDFVDAYMEALEKALPSTDDENFEYFYDASGLQIGQPAGSLCDTIEQDDQPWW